MEHQDSNLEAVQKLFQDANLDTMPVEVLSAIMATLSFNDVKRLCSLNSRIKHACKRSDLIELKAREKVAREAPLGALVKTYRDHANLIDRGMKITETTSPCILISRTPFSRAAPRVPSA